MLRLATGEVDEDGDPTFLDTDEWLSPEWPVWAGYKIAQPGDLEWWLNREEDWSWTGGLLTVCLGKAAQVREAEESPRWFHKTHLRVAADGQPPAHYSPGRCSKGLLRDALRVDVASLDSLLVFVRSWGLLGVGTGESAQAERLLSMSASEPNFDSVWATRRALTVVQEHFQWLRALKNGQWSATSIPRASREGDILDAARALMPEPDWRALEDGYEGDGTALRRKLSMFGTTDPYVASFARRQMLLHAAHLPVDQRGAWGNRPTAEMHWRAFASSIEEHLRRIHPAMRWEPGRGPVPTWRVRAPIDAIWAAIWDEATTGGKIVRCPGCHTWFSRSRRNQVYCSDACANRARFRRWYAKEHPRRANVPKNVPASASGRAKPGQRQPRTKTKTRR